MIGLYMFITIVIGLAIMIFIFSFINYYLYVFDSKRWNYYGKIQSKRDFYIALIPFQRWIKEWRKKYKELK